MSPGLAAPQLEVALRVNHLDVSADFAPHLLSVQYVDNLKGEADGLELHLEDAAGLWQGRWFPVKGTTVEAALGWAGAPLMDCGEFAVDEIESSGPPDVVVVRCLAAGGMNGLRTQVSRAYEGMGLRQVAQAVAAKYGLTVVGEVPDLAWRRRSQFQETDLAFLQRFAWEHGIVFSVKGRMLVFHALEALEGLPPVLRLTRDRVTRYSFRDRVHEATGGVQASYFDLDTKEAIETTLRGQGMGAGDVLRVRRRVEGHAQQQRLAKHALHVAKGWSREGTLTLPGHRLLRAGANVELDGWGVFDGLWQLKQARHAGTREGGYEVEVNVRQVAGLEGAA